NIPLAILLAVAVTAVCYLLAIVAYHAVLTTPQIVSGVAVAAVFTKVTVPPAMWVVVPCIGISATGIVNVIIFTATSVARRTPLVSLILLGLVTCVVILMGDITSVLGAYTFFRSAGETVAILGLYRLRRKFPAAADTYVVPSVFPCVYLVVNISLAAVALTRDTSRYVIPLVLCLSGVPLYFLSKSRLRKSGPLQQIHGMHLESSTEDDSHQLRLPRSLGLVSATSYVVGGIIGVGIFVRSPDCAAECGSLAGGGAVCVGFLRREQLLWRPRLR
ncbi:hypothetical protein BaRGS_00032179, partial [Batillaria attramentaria]